MERTTHEHQDTRQYHPYIFAWLAQTRPVGKLIDQGHIYLGRTKVEGFPVDVEADIEWSGSKDLRVIITEGQHLSYTARLIKDGLDWRVANKSATLKVWSDRERKYKFVLLCTIPFKTPHEFPIWFHETMSKRAERVAVGVVY